MRRVSSTVAFFFTCLMAVVLLEASDLYAASATWNSTSNGDWNDTANWNPNTTFPNGVGEVATLGSGGFGAASETRVVTLPGPITIGTLTMQAVTTNKNYNLTGVGPLTFDVASGNAVLSANLSGTARQTLNVPIQIADPLNIDPFVFNSLLINSSMSGTVGNPNVTINKINTGTVTWTGNNNFGTGTVNVNGGTLILATSATGLNNVGGGANTTIFINTGTLSLAGIAGGVNRFQSDVEAIGTNVTLNSTRSDSSSVNSTNEIGSITVRSGSTLNANNASGLGFALAIASGEFLTVENNATFNWTRTPTFSFNGDLLIRNGATLRGTGTININNGHQGDELRIQSGGKVAPGFGAGRLFIGTGSGMNTRTIFEPGSILEMEIFGDTPGVGYDQLQVQGDLTISGANLTLLDNGYLFDPQKDIYLWLVNNTSAGALTGQFAGLANGAVATTIGGRNFTIHYGADFATQALTGGNDIALFSLGVPEPGSASLLAGGLFAIRRRRRATRSAGIFEHGHNGLPGQGRGGQGQG